MDGLIDDYLSIYMDLLVDWLLLGVLYCMIIMSSGLSARGMSHDWIDLID